MSDGSGTKTIFRRVSPYLVALLVFITIAAVYFAPQFSGKTLVQSDMVQYKGATEEVIAHRERYGEDPQWLGSSFSGMPANLVNMAHDTQLVARMKPALDFLGSPASQIFIAMAAFFVMLLMVGLNPWAAIVPSIAYGLSTYFFIIIDVGHVTKMWALAYAPLMLGAVFYTFRKNMWLGAALTALFGSLQIAAGHPQITYYFAMVLAAFWINELVVAIKEKTFPRFAKATGLIVIAAIMAVGSNYSALHDTYQYSKDSIRGGSELAAKSDQEQKRGSGLDLDYATAWSYGKMESFNMFIPDLMGGSSSGGFSQEGQVSDQLRQMGYLNQLRYLGSYWGDQPGTSGPTYIGAVIIFLCVMGLFLLRGRCKWWLVTITLIALMLAWGRNFMWFTELFFNILPGYNKFRTVAMILVIAQWSVPFIAALLLGKLWNEKIERKELVRAIRNSVYVCGGVALFFILFGGTIFGFVNPYEGEFPKQLLDAMMAERLSILRLDAFRSLAFVLLTAGAMWLFAAGKLKIKATVAVLAVLVCADLIPVDLRYLPQSKFIESKRVEIKPTEADLEILADETPGFRVLNLTVNPFNDATTSYFHRSVGGYHGAKMQRYQDLIERYLGRNDLNIYNMLNVRYFILPDREGGKPVAQFNPDANGTAWFVDEVITVDSPDEELEMLAAIDTKTQALVDKRYAQMLTDAPASVLSQADSSVLAGVPAGDSASVAVIPPFIRLDEYRPNRLVYNYTSQKPGVAVFSEIFYDNGWTAYIDGVEAQHFRADYVLRGMVLPAGNHKVEFVYRAAGFDRAANIALVFSILILASVIAAVVVTILHNRKKDAKNERGQKA